jgi:hypothetical protein
MALPNICHIDEGFLELVTHLRTLSQMSSGGYAKVFYLPLRRVTTPVMSVRMNETLVPNVRGRRQECFSGLCGFILTPGFRCACFTSILLPIDCSCHSSLVDQASSGPKYLSTYLSWRGFLNSSGGKVLELHWFWRGTGTRASAKRQRQGRRTENGCTHAVTQMHVYKSDNNQVWMQY